MAREVTLEDIRKITGNVRQQSPAVQTQSAGRSATIDDIRAITSKTREQIKAEAVAQPPRQVQHNPPAKPESVTMRQNVDTLKKQRDDALIKAGAYSRAGNMQQQAKEQRDIASELGYQYENARSAYKTQKNMEELEDYNPNDNHFKAGDMALSGIQNAFQSFGQNAAMMAAYANGPGREEAWKAKQLIDSGMNGLEAQKLAGIETERKVPMLDYKTKAEIRHERNVESTHGLERLGLQLGNTIFNMAPSLALNLIAPGSQAGLIFMSASAAGNKFTEASEKYDNPDMAFALAMGSGLAAYGTEQLGGLYGKAWGGKVGQALQKKLVTENPALYAYANSVGGKWLRDAISEGIEEGAEDIVNYAIEKSLTGESDEMDNIGYDMLLGALAGGFLGGANATTRAVNYNRLGKTIKKSPAAVQQQIEEGLSKGEGTAPAIYAAEAQKKPTPQMLGRLFEANQSFDAESGLSKIQGDITQLSIRELKAMMNNANAIVQAAETLGVKPTPESVMTEVFSKQKEAAIRTAQDGVEQAFSQIVDNPANAGEVAYNSAIQGAPANQSAAQKVYNDPAARESFAKLAGIEYTGNPAADVAAIEVATKKLGETGRQVVSEAEYTERMTEAAEMATAELEARAEAEADALERESRERWLSIEQNTDIDVDGKRHVREITDTDVRGNSEISYKKAEIPNSKKPAVNAVEGAAKFLGKTIVWFEGAVQVNGQYRLTNGYRAPDGTIYVNINSRDPLMVTFGHELFHDLVADSKYSGMIDTLVENPDYADMVKGMMNAKTELYERNGIELDPNAAAEEVAADISGDLLGSRDMLEYIGARNTEAATGIKGFLNRILKKLKGKPSAQEAYNRLSESQKALLDGMEGRTEAEEAGKISYSLMREAVEKNNRPFAEQFADYKAGKMKPTELFALGNTSQYLQAAGIGNEPIVMAQSVVAKAQRKAKVDTHGHNLSDNVLLKLPEMLDKPALLLKSDTVPNAAVIVTSTADSDGNPVVVALHLSRSEGFDIVTRVASLYGKENSRDFLAEQMLRGNLLGYSKKEANRLLHRDGLQLPRRNTAVDFDTINIPQDTDVVNTHSMQTGAKNAQEKLSLMEMPTTDSAGSKDIRYSLMEDAQYMADIDRIVSEATEKANDELKAAQAEVKNIRQQLADYRQQATAEAKKTAAWKEGEAKLIADLSEAQSKEKKARVLSSYMDEYNALSERYRGEVRATDTEALTQYNEKLSNLRSGFRGEMEKLAIEQGAFKRGEKAARDIYVPTSVNGQKVTRGTRTILEASQTPESMLEEHAKEILAGARGYEVIGDKKAQEYAERIIDKDGYGKADELFTNAVNGDQVLDKKTLVLGEYLYMEAAKAGDVKNAMRYAADVAAAATRAGQVVQAMRVLKKATPTGKLYYLNRMVDTMNKNIVDNGGDPILIDEGLARKLLEAENIKDPKEQGKAVDETIDEIEQNIADQIPATAWDKWNAWRYLSMLGNIRTQVRNVVGNAAFMPLVATKNLLAAGMEKAFIRNGGRTKSAFFTKTNVGKRLMEFGKKDFDTVVDEIQGGGKYNQSSSIEEKRTIFKSKAIEGWRKLTNKAMDKGDEIFSKHHYARALAGYLHANHLDYDKITRNTPQAQEVLNKARAYAILEAQKATFRDANQLASFINKTKRNLLKKAQTAETKGAKAGWYVGTAVAEGIMPFTKTPIDILARGVEYSPIGLIKGIKEAVYDVKKGNKTAAEAIDTLSAGLTGTGIFALGYFLQSLGLLAGALDDDKESKYKKDRGAQGFAIHIGDKYYTIDWLAPFSLPLFTGAAVAETVENGDEVSFATLADVFSTISEPMLEMSMLQGVNSALSNGQYSSDSKIVSFMTNQITGYLSQANPTILGQIARAVDDTSRNAYYYDPNYKGFVQTGKVFGDKQIAKIPFASKALTSRIDLWGNKQENTGGSFFGRLAYNMLSPGYYSEESNDPVDVALTKLYEETEDTAVLPSKPSKTVTNNKTDYKMNAKQYEEYCIVKGQTAHKEIQTFINSAEYKKMSNEDRVDVLEHLYKYSTYKAQKNLLGNKYVASSTYSRCVKAEAYAKGGNPVYKYFVKG